MAYNPYEFEGGSQELLQTAYQKMLRGLLPTIPTLYPRYQEKNVEWSDSSQQQPPEEPGFFEKMGQFFTGTESEADKIQRNKNTQAFEVGKADVAKGATLPSEYFQPGIEYSNYNIGRGIAQGQLVQQGNKVFRTFIDATGQKQVEGMPVFEINNAMRAKPIDYNMFSAEDIPDPIRRVTTNLAMDVVGLFQPEQIEGAKKAKFYKEARAITQKDLSEATGLQGFADTAIKSTILDRVTNAVKSLATGNRVQDISDKVADPESSYASGGMLGEVVNGIADAVVITIATGGMGVPTGLALAAGGLGGVPYYAEDLAVGNESIGTMALKTATDVVTAYFGGKLGMSIMEKGITAGLTKLATNGGWGQRFGGLIAENAKALAKNALVQGGLSAADISVALAIEKNKLGDRAQFNFVGELGKQTAMMLAMNLAMDIVTHGQTNLTALKNNPAMQTAIEEQSLRLFNKVGEKVKQGYSDKQILTSLKAEKLVKDDPRTAGNLFNIGMRGKGSVAENNALALISMARDMQDGIPFRNQQKAIIDEQLAAGKITPAEYKIALQEINAKTSQLKAEGAFEYGIMTETVQGDHANFKGRKVYTEHIGEVSEDGQKLLKYRQEYLGTDAPLNVYKTLEEKVKAETVVPFTTDQPIEKVKGTDPTITSPDGKPMPVVTISDGTAMNIGATVNRRTQTAKANTDPAGTALKKLIDSMIPRGIFVNTKIIDQATQKQINMASMKLIELYERYYGDVHGISYADFTERLAELSLGLGTKPPIYWADSGPIHQQRISDPAWHTDPALGGSDWSRNANIQGILKVAENERGIIFDGMVGQLIQNGMEPAEATKTVLARFGINAKIEADAKTQFIAKTEKLSPAEMMLKLNDPNYKFYEVPKAKPGEGGAAKAEAKPETTTTTAEPTAVKGEAPAGDLREFLTALGIDPDSPMLKGLVDDAGNPLVPVETPPPAPPPIKPPDNPPPPAEPPMPVPPSPEPPKTAPPVKAVPTTLEEAKAQAAAQAAAKGAKPETATKKTDTAQKAKDAAEKARIAQEAKKDADELLAKKQEDAQKKKDDAQKKKDDAQKKKDDAIKKKEEDQKKRDEDQERKAKEQVAAKKAAQEEADQRIKDRRQTLDEDDMTKGMPRETPIGEATRKKAEQRASLESTNIKDIDEDIKDIDAKMLDLRRRSESGRVTQTESTHEYKVLSHLAGIKEIVKNYAAQLKAGRINKFQFDTLVADIYEFAYKHMDDVGKPNVIRKILRDADTPESQAIAGSMFEHAIRKADYKYWPIFYPQTKLRASKQQLHAQIDMAVQAKEMLPVVGKLLHAMVDINTIAIRGLEFFIAPPKGLHIIGELDDGVVKSTSAKQVVGKNREERAQSKLANKIKAGLSHLYTIPHEMMHMHYFNLSMDEAEQFIRWHYKNLGRRANATPAEDVQFLREQADKMGMHFRSGPDVEIKYALDNPMEAFANIGGYYWLTKAGFFDKDVPTTNKFYRAIRNVRSIFDKAIDRVKSQFAYGTKPEYFSSDEFKVIEKLFSTTIDEKALAKIRSAKEPFVNPNAKPKGPEAANPPPTTAAEKTKAAVTGAKSKKATEPTPTTEPVPTQGKVVVKSTKVVQGSTKGRTAQEVEMANGWKFKIEPVPDGEGGRNWKIVSATGDEKLPKLLNSKKGKELQLTDLGPGNKDEALANLAKRTAALEELLAPKKPVKTKPSAPKGPATTKTKEGQTKPPPSLTKPPGGDPPPPKPVTTRKAKAAPAKAAEKGPADLSVVDKMELEQDKAIQHGLDEIWNKDGALLSKQTGSTATKEHAMDTYEIDLEGNVVSVGVARVKGKTPQGTLGRQDEEWLVFQEFGRGTNSEQVPLFSILNAFGNKLKRHTADILTKFLNTQEKPDYYGHTYSRMTSTEAVFHVAKGVDGHTIWMRMPKGLVIDEGRPKPPALEMATQEIETRVKQDIGLSRAEYEVVQKALRAGEKPPPTLAKIQESLTNNKNWMRIPVRALAGYLAANAINDDEDGQKYMMAMMAAMPAGTRGSFGKFFMSQMKNLAMRFPDNKIANLIMYQRVHTLTSQNSAINSPRYVMAQSAAAKTAALAEHKRLQDATKIINGKGGLEHWETGDTKNTIRKVSGAHNEAGRRAGKFLSKIKAEGIALTRGVDEVAKSLNTKQSTINKIIIKANAETFEGNILIMHGHTDAPSRLEKLMQIEVNSTKDKVIERIQRYGTVEGLQLTKAQANDIYEKAYMPQRRMFDATDLQDIDVELARVKYGTTLENAPEVMEKLQQQLDAYKADIKDPLDQLAEFKQIKKTRQLTAAERVERRKIIETLKKVKNTEIANTNKLIGDMRRALDHHEQNGKMHALPRWEYQKQDAPYAVSIAHWDWDEQRNKYVRVDEANSEYQYFQFHKTPLSRQKDVEAWFAKNKAALVEAGEFGEGFYKMDVIGKDGTPKQILLKINDDIDIRDNTKYWSTDIEHFKQQMYLLLSKEGTNTDLLSKAVRAAQRVSDKYDLLADGATPEQHQFAGIAKEFLNKWQDPTQLSQSDRLASLQHLMELSIARRNPRYYYSRNVAGWMPADGDAGAWNAWARSSAELVSNRSTDALKRTYMTGEIDAQLNHLNDYGVHNKYMDLLLGLREDLHFHDQQGTLILPIKDTELDVGGFINGINTAAVAGAVSFNGSAMFNNMVGGFVGMMGGLKELGFKSARYLPKIFYNDMKMLMGAIGHKMSDVSPQSISRMIDSGLSSLELFKNDPMMKAVATKILNEGVVADVSIEHVRHFKFFGYPISQKLQDIMFATVKIIEMSNRFQSAMIYAANEAKINPFKQGMDREAYIESIVDGAHHFVNKTQGKFDQVFRGRMERAILRNAPFRMGYTALTLMGPQLNQLYLWSGAISKIAAGPGWAKKGFASLAALALTTWLVAGDKAMPIVNDAINLIDSLSGGSNDSDMESIGPMQKTLMEKFKDVKKDALRFVGVPEKDVQFMSDVMEEGIMSALTGYRIGWEESFSGWHSPLVLDKMAQSYQDMMEMRKDFFPGFMKLIAHNFVAGGKFLQATANLSEGEFYDTKFQLPQGRKFDEKDFVLYSLFGKPLADRRVNKGAFQGANPMETKSQKQEFIDKLTSVDGIDWKKSGYNVSGLKELIKSSKLYEKAEKLNRELIDKYDKDQRQTAIEKSKERLDKFVEKNYKLLQEIAYAGRETYGESVKTAKLKSEIERAVYEYYGSEVIAEVLPKYIGYQLGHKAADEEAIIFQNGTYVNTYRPISSYPYSQQGYYYALRKLYNSMARRDKAEEQESKITGEEYESDYDINADEYGY